MEFIISFMEGIITFISPCLLPMIPIYLSFLTGGENDKKSRIYNAIGFVAGFSIVFISMGAFAGSIGFLLKKYTTVVNFITGLIVIGLGLNFLGVLKINIINRTKKLNTKYENINFMKAIVFGMAFSIGWTPCVGTFLGSALMLASKNGSWLHGVLMLCCYSIGLGIPFIISVLLLDYLSSVFGFIKRHYTIINITSGIFLVIIGTMMLSGTLGYFISFFSF